MATKGEIAHNEQFLLLSPWFQTPSAAEAFPYFGANFWQDVEKAVQFEIIDTNGQNYKANAGIKIFGGWSRGNPQKSFSLLIKFKTKEFGIDISKPSSPV